MYVCVHSYLVMNSGFLYTLSTDREAARAWTLVLKEASKLSSSLWYLQAAVCESRLCFHAGQPVGGEDPSSPLAIGVHVCNYMYMHMYMYMSIISDANIILLSQHDKYTCTCTCSLLHTLCIPEFNFL